MHFFQLLYQYNDWGLLALRLALAVIFIVHGKGKFAMWKAGATAPMLGLMKFLAFAETLGGIAMFFGFLTHFAAVGLGIVMLGALRFKTMVWKMPFSAHDKTGWEFDLMILAACVALLISGPGSVSLDAVWGL